MKSNLPPIAILCGGMGTRLYPYTNKHAKSAVLVNGRPFIHYVIENLVNLGFSEIIMCVGHYQDELIEICGDGSNFGVKISYSKDNPNNEKNKLLGTGGAILNAIDNFNDHFFVTYGDTYIDFSPREMIENFLDTRPAAVMAIYKNNGLYDKSNAYISDGGWVVYEKGADLIGQERLPPDHIDLGVSLIDCTKFKSYAFKQNLNHFDLAIFMKYISSKKSLQGVVYPQRFFEIGTPEALKETEEYLRCKNVIC